MSGSQQVNTIPRQHEQGHRLMLALLLILSFGQPAGAEVQRGTASWYSYASSRQEGNSGVMANGEIMRDEAFTAASWDYPFGTKLSICTTRHPRQCAVAIVTDRGPSRRLYRKGRLLDLSRATFEALAPLSQGVIPIVIEDIR